MFGDDERRSWDDAREFGYVSAGGGSRWSRPLQRLEPGVRVFVHHPHDGYVGVGQVLDGPVQISDFIVTVHDKELPILEVPLRNENIKEHADNPELAEYMVRVRWKWTVPSGQGLWARNFFFRRVTVTELRDPETSRKICANAGISSNEGDVAPS